ncbi:hypothetical protein [Arsenophonus endosymbiont of Bemisia tabaci]|uniref:hypothetical protein n=1 Tax=Arsenophonus endosymbiont of Bemisia tabaci TaxID=536059 RepID=UPI0015F36B63|nr:hypothetical protein [Arsenophonus endosymbiont of Bemisia tabaci]
MITSNYSISVNLYSRKAYIFVIKIKTFSYILQNGVIILIVKTLSFLMVILH